MVPEHNVEAIQHSFDARDPTLIAKPSSEDRETAMAYMADFVRLQRSIPTSRRE
jgi:hypothetical protein